MRYIQGAGAVLGLVLAACTATPAAPSNTAAPAPQTGPTAAAVAQPTGGAPAAPPAAAKPTAVATAGRLVSSINDIEPLNPRGTMKLSVNPDNTAYLPLIYAAEKGYFARAGIDVQVISFQGQSATTQLPLLLRGDVDASGAVPAGSLFNQFSQGFGVKLLAGLDLPRQGRAASNWLNVVSAKKDQIKDLKDLKPGMTIDGAVEGSPTSMLADEVVRQAGLDGQITVTHRSKGPTDMLALIKTGEVDVVASSDPLATQAEKQGYSVRWKTFSDVAPWFQAFTIAASDKFLQERRAVAEKFLEVYVVTTREIDASNGAWTDDLVNIYAKAAGVEPQLVRDEGGVPYYDPNDIVSTDSLARTQDYLVAKGQLPQKVDVQQMPDKALLDEALTRVGRAN